MRAMRSNFYNPGVKGGATGSHIHIAVFRGKPHSANSGSWSGCDIFTTQRAYLWVDSKYLFVTEKIKKPCSFKNP